MKVTGFAWLLQAAISAALLAPLVLAAPATDSQALQNDPLQELDELRAELLRYEAPIIQTFLSRTALNASIPSEAPRVEAAYKALLKVKSPYALRQADKEEADWFKSAGKAYVEETRLPAATLYKLPEVLARDAVLDKPVKGKGIFPVGRRPQDPPRLWDFVLENFAVYERYVAVDSASVILLDTTLLELSSARILIGRKIALAKFEVNQQSYCRVLTQKLGDKEARAEVEALIVDNKQQVRVLGRVQEKAKDLVQLFNDGVHTFPADTADQILRLFQAYIIPLTTSVEVDTILALADWCYLKLQD